MKTVYSVKKFVYVPAVDDKNTVFRHVELIGSNLTWQKAKELRKQNKGSWIV